MVTCGSCGEENPAGYRFCGGCGNALGSHCPHCNSAVPAGQRFCGNCGQDLSESAPEPTSISEEEPPARSAELRLVSVLFCDLVGSTSMAEQRDDDEFRELLDGYYEVAKRVVARYGGTIQKFIGDAVVAVWGTQQALEDDAGRSGPCRIGAGRFGGRLRAAGRPADAGGPCRGGDGQGGGGGRPRCPRGRRPGQHRLPGAVVGKGRPSAGR